MPIRVKLDHLMLDRRMTLTELASRVDLTLAMQVGGVTVFNLPESLPIFVDERIMALDYVILGTGGRNGKVKLAPQALARVAGVKVIRDLARARDEAPAR